MSRSTHGLDPALLTHLVRCNTQGEHPALARLRTETATLADAQMQISPEQGRLMAWLAQRLGVRRALEVGVFTGYSALCVALQLPADGRLVALDRSAEWTAIAQRHWQEAGVAERIELRLGDANSSLDTLLADGEEGCFDFAFIDADKGAYPSYYDKVMRLLRPGGVVALDNMFLGGRVVDPTDDDPAAGAVAALTERIFSDPAVDPCLVPVSDGLLVVCKSGAGPR